MHKTEEEGAEVLDEPGHVRISQKQKRRAQIGYATS